MYRFNKSYYYASLRTVFVLVIHRLKDLLCVQIIKEIYVCKKKKCVDTYLPAVSLQTMSVSNSNTVL